MASQNNTNRRPSHREPAKKQEGFFAMILNGASQGDIDYTFLSIVAGVLAMGLIMLLSASAPRANSMFENSYYFFFRQFIFAVLGVVGMLIISRIDYRIYRQYASMAMIVCCFLLLIVLVPGIGVERNGARRWLFGVVQPSEFMKPAIAMCFAHLLAKYNTDTRRIKELLPYFGILIAVVALMLFEPHVSGAVIIIGICAVILVVAGMPVIPIAITLLESELW